MASSLPRTTQPSLPCERRPGRVDGIPPTRTPNPTAPTQPGHDRQRNIARPVHGAFITHPRTSSLPRPNQSVSKPPFAAHDRVHAAKLRRKPSVIESYVAHRQLSSTPEDLSVRSQPSYNNSVNPSKDLYGLGFSNVGSAVLHTADSAVRSNGLICANDDWPTVQDSRPFQTPTPLSNHSLTPSLVFTDSPSAVSHTQTPLSFTSHSPNQVTSSPSISGKWNGTLFSSYNSSKENSIAALRESAVSSLRVGSPPVSESHSASDVREAVPRDSSKTPRPPNSWTTPPELAHLVLASGRLEPSKGNQRTEPQVERRKPSKHGQNFLHAQQNSASNSSSRFGYKDLYTDPPEKRLAYQDRQENPADVPIRSDSPNMTGDGSVESRPGSSHSSSSKQSSRLGFFQRRIKPDPEPTTEDPTKIQRKGPAAGTGHEGYGRHVPRRRSGGSASRLPTPGSTLPQPPHHRQASGGSSSEGNLDTFLAQRLEPVYLRGDGSVNGSQARTSDSTAGDESEQLSFGSPATVTSSKSSLELQRGQSKSAVASDCPGSGWLTRPGFGYFSDPACDQPTTRSNLKDHLHSEAQRPATAAPTAPNAAVDMSLGECHVSVRRSSLSESLSSNDSRSKRPHWLGFDKAKAATRWKTFHKSPTVSITSSQIGAMEEDGTSSDSTCQPTRQLAHYAIFETSKEFDFEELQSVMEEADRAFWESKPARRKAASTKRHERAPMTQQNTAPQDAATVPTGSLYEVVGPATGASPEHRVSSASGLELVSDREARFEHARPPRLPQVGRIPRVVSRRDRTRQMPISSFSRPFHGGHAPVFARRAHQKDAIAILDDTSEGPEALPDKISPEFLSLNRRKDSDVSFSSSSCNSWFPSTASATAVGCAPGAPLTADEVWAEYDDLIDAVSGPDSTCGSAKFVLTPAVASLAAIRSQLRVSHSLSNSSASPRDVVSRPHSLGRQSRHSILSERSSVQSQESRKKWRGFSLSDAASTDLAPSRASVKSEDARGVDPMSMANLRFGALMVSKWLSFGRVLFSPAHYDLEETKSEERVLVIDGLGKDWSYYCALTYAQASVYSIGPWASKNAARNSLGGGLGHLPNYRHFMHPGLGSDFPFPRGFFSVVVFRFPVITSDRALHHAISECKRVLRPGGYIEVSMLDLDLSNMGNRARRMVRELKTRIHAADSSASLKSAADNVQFLLGRRGFDNLNRCMVGVPAAGAISESRDSSRDEKNVGIMELMQDTSAKGDEHITKMVARVGRWWYSRCYESKLVADGDPVASIWADRALLHECEMLATSFKLLICYAQKPVVAKRRAVSL